MNNIAKMYGCLKRIGPVGEEGNATAESNAELAVLVWVRVHGSGHIKSLLMVKGGSTSGSGPGGWFQTL